MYSINIQLVTRGGGAGTESAPVHVTYRLSNKNQKNEVQQYLDRQNALSFLIRSET